MIPIFSFSLNYYLIAWHNHLNDQRTVFSGLYSISAHDRLGPVNFILFYLFIRQKHSHKYA